MSVQRNAALLRQFLVVAREGSLTSAAQALAVTQPALSKSIHKLEAALGATLFERLPRGVTLTKYGQMLLPHAQRIDTECRLADLEILSFTKGHRGRLRLGAGQMFSATLLPQAIARLHREYPELTIELVTAHPEANFSHLLAGELDIAFGWLPPPARVPDYLVVQRFVDLTMRVLASDEHPLVSRRTVSADDLVRYPWVVLEHDREVVRALLTKLADARSHHVEVRVEVTSLVSLIALLKAGPYLSCFSLPLTGTGLAFVPYKDPILRARAGVVMHRSLEHYRPAAMLIDFVREAAKGATPASRGARDRHAS